MPSPSSTTYPTTLSDLRYTDPDNPVPSTRSIYRTLDALHKRALTLTNRLASIHADSLFVADLAARFPGYPVIANERCGSWYVPPGLKRGSAYFKSTDGHVGQWGFSLRRLNLEVLRVLGEGGDGGGVIVVDSTRRGKRVPDALRRTVPCWVAVWNRVLFEGEEEVGRREGWWAVRGTGLEKGEVALIERRVDGWIEGLKSLKLDLDEWRRKVGKPIRCVWAVHGEDGIDDGMDDEDLGENEVQSDRSDCYTLVLCSASKRVLGAEMSEDGYIQGAGDDNESWSCGLTPDLFWKHKDQLMRTAEDDLPELVGRLVHEAKANTEANEAVLIAPTTTLFLASQGILGQGEGPPTGYDAVVNCNGVKGMPRKNVLQLGCRSGKLGSRDLRDSLQAADPFMNRIFTQKPDSKVVVICETGKDLAVGVILVLLCAYFDAQGEILAPGQSNCAVDKKLVKQRLAWITSCRADANPSGSTLQAANAFMMGRPP